MPNQAATVARVTGRRSTARITAARRAGIAARWRRCKSAGRKPNSSATVSSNLSNGSRNAACNSASIGAAASWLAADRARASVSLALMVAASAVGAALPLPVCGKVRELDGRAFANAQALGAALAANEYG